MEHPFFINNGPPSNRSEALRWLTIAEKLLTNRDLVGSKSFATRARESDPTLAHATDQILGIVDTLIAGDKRINNHYYDYYSILQIPPNQTQNTEFIAEQYRRFAFLLNPQNNNFPLSDQAFRLVSDSFSVLSNPLRKSMYDKELGFFVNLYPVASAPAPVSFVHHSSDFSTIPSSNADQVFVNFNNQDQGSHTAAASEVSFMSSSSGLEEQPFTFVRQETHPVTSVPVTNTDEQQQQQQPATFFNLNQPQPVTSVRGSNRETPSFGTGLSPTRGQEPVVSVEQQGNQQRAERNENVVVGNSGNQPASTSNNVKEKEAAKTDGADKRIPSFWTACPYCYRMYEYPLEYADCTLRCQNCRRAFQAVTIASPPPVIAGKEAYFCCWGYMPLGLSMETFERSRNNGSSWSPFSPMFTCPRVDGDGGKNVNNNHVVGGQSNVNNLGGLQNNASGSKSGGARRHSTPRIYVDEDDELLVEIY